MHPSRAVGDHSQLIYEGEPQKRDALGCQYVLFESSFDGADLDAYLELLCHRMPKRLTRFGAAASATPA